MIVMMKRLLPVDGGLRSRAQLVFLIQEGGLHVHMVIGLATVKGRGDSVWSVPEKFWRVTKVESLEFWSFWRVTKSESLPLLP
jgi:hypothetical protein